MLKRFGPIVFYGYFGLFFIVTLGLSAYYSRYDGTPKQPIAFPHDKHASKLGLQCEQCHQYADKSKHAGAPPVEFCMSCHSNVFTDRPEIQKLTKYYEDKKPVEWAQLHKVPEWVYFSHKRHIAAGVACQECHGEVQAAGGTEMRKNKTLQMGFCVSCHRQKDAPLDCYTCHK